MSEFSNSGATFLIVSSSIWGTKELFVQEHWISLYLIVPLNSKIMKHLVFRNSGTTFMIVFISSWNISESFIQEHWSSVYDCSPQQQEHQSIVHSGTCGPPLQLLPSAAGAEENHQSGPLELRLADYSHQQ